MCLQSSGLSYLARRSTIQMVGSNFNSLMASRTLGSPTWRSLSSSKTLPRVLYPIISDMLYSPRWCVSSRLYAQHLGAPTCKRSAASTACCDGSHALQSSLACGEPRLSITRQLLQQRLRILRPRRLRDLAAQPRDNLAQAATGRFVRWAALCAPLAHCSLLTPTPLPLVAWCQLG